MNRTSIEWTDLSANPLKFRDPSGKVVWGCVHASTGCLHCYSEALAKRYGRGGPFNVPTMNALTPFLDEAELHKMRTAKTIGGKPVSGSRCFIGDMTDIFGEWVSDDLLNHLFSQTLELRTDVTWQLLTKRAERMRDYLSWRWGEGRIPSRHIHIGVSVENQDTLHRIDALKDAPAAVRFVSFEPLLEHLGAVILDGIHWAIIGGESGPNARRCSAQWVRSLVNQCFRQRVRPFVKQLGSFVIDRNDAGFDGSDVRSWPVEIEERDAIEYDIDGYRTDWQGADVRIRLKSRKGNDPTEWPADLRIRQYPSPEARS